MWEELLCRIRKMDPRKLFMAAAIFAMIVVCGFMVQRRAATSDVQEAEAKAEVLEKRKEKKKGAEEKGGEDKAAEAVEASIVPGQYPIMGASSIRVEEMVDFFEENCGSYPQEILGDGGAPDIETFCEIYYEEASAEGVRPEVAFAQTMKETGWLQYGGDAQITQYNFAGLGTTGGGVPGNSYPDVRTGVRAQIQHLKAYATSDALDGECVDDRYEYVTKGSAPYVEWLGQKENPEGYGWATGENYGYDIVEMIHDMRNQDVDQDKEEKAE